MGPRVVLGRDGLEREDRPGNQELSDNDHPERLLHSYGRNVDVMKPNVSHPSSS